jgi:N-carbamoyl-L-amino-acid hydrolase
VTFTLNIGGIRNSVMEDLHGAIMHRATQLEKEHGVRYEFGPRAGTPATDLDEGIIACVEQAGQEYGIVPFRMPTVGHDAALFQRRGIPTSVLLLRNANGSHNPQEHMEITDFELGTKVLARAVDKLCRS